tara:strand:+ start:469 stop:1770 length:1302 start_codon:yes stop_codon:yes gene_type:complete
MKKKFFLILLFSFSISGEVFAITLLDALNLAFKNNTELNAERENIEVAKQDLNISKGNYLPNVTITGSKSSEDTNKLTNRDGSDASISDVDPTTTTLKIDQKIIDFGRKADYQKSQSGIILAEAKLLKKEQEILYKAVEVYSGLILANEEVTINQINVNLLERQLETDSIRLDKGDITLSDLAQSEASLLGARAKLIESQNNFVASKLNYENVIGPINDLESLEKSINYIGKIPTDLNEALDLSKNNNPDIMISKIELEQSEDDVQIAKSDLSPSASISLEKSYTEDLSTTYDERQKDILKASISWPFYSGGKNYAKVKKNKNLNNQKKLLYENVVKSNKTNIASAWSYLQSSKSLLDSVNSQVKAAEIANEGITGEYESGAGQRSTLDVIQSNSLLLNAKISLANSERNYLLSQFNLLKSIGLLNSDYLKLQ